jgi:hypothetical protein
VDRQTGHTKGHIWPDCFGSRRRKVRGGEKGRHSTLMLKSRPYELRFQKKTRPRHLQPCSNLVGLMGANQCRKLEATSP